MRANHEKAAAEKEAAKAKKDAYNDKDAVEKRQKEKEEKIAAQKA